MRPTLYLHNTLRLSVRQMFYLYMCAMYVAGVLHDYVYEHSEELKYLLNKFGKLSRIYLNIKNKTLFRIF